MFEATNVLLGIAAIFFLIIVFLLCVIVNLLVQTREIRKLSQNHFRTFVGASSGQAMKFVNRSSSSTRRFIYRELLGG